MSDDYGDDDMPQIQSEAHSEEEAPSGALAPILPPTEDAPMEVLSESVAPIDQVTDALDGKDGATLLKIASRYGVTHDDPLWSAVLVLLGSQKAAAETLEAAGKIETAGDALGEKIFTQTTRAGDELKTVLMDAATKAGSAFVQKLIAGIAHAIDKPITAGVQKIEEATGGLDASAQAQRSAILAEWRKDLTSAATAEASRRNSLAAATSWATVLITCVIFMTGGAVLTHKYEAYSHHLLPPGYTLIYKTDNRPDCGLTSAYPNNPMCFVRKD